VVADSDKHDAPDEERRLSDAWDIYQRARQNYQGALERISEVAEEVVLTSHRSLGMTSVDQDALDGLMRILLHARQLQERLNSSLIGADNDAHPKTLRQRLQRSE
jgi:hypothetical protein